MDCGNDLDRSINPFFLTFRDRNVEMEFANDFILDMRPNRKKVRVLLYICVVIQYMALGGFGWDLSNLPSDVKFKIVSAPFMVAGMIIRGLFLFDVFPKKISANVAEFLDQVIFECCFVYLGVLAALRDQHNAMNFLIAIIEGSIICPSRFSRQVISYVIGLASYIVCAVTLSHPTNAELAIIVAMSAAVGFYQLIGAAQLELKTRESFLLQRQTKQDCEDKVRTAAESLEQEQAISKAKNRLMSVVSHELRTPCQAISAMSSLLVESSALNEPDRESASIIQRSSDLLCAIVNDFLDISRLESDQALFKKEDVDLAEAAEDTLDIVSQSLYKDGKQLEAIYTIEPDVSQHIVSDCQRIKQMLLNLTANAVKFCDTGRIQIRFCMASPLQSSLPNSIPESNNVPESSPSPSSGFAITPGGVVGDDRNRSSAEFCVGDHCDRDDPTCTISAPNVDFSRPMICIEVSDTGIGITAENLPKVFQEFFMVDDGPSRRYNGTGLGLAIVRRTAVGMGGTVQVTSRGIGEGTTFRIFLPYIPAPRRDISPPSSPSPLPTLPPPPSPSRTLPFPPLHDNLFEQQDQSRHPATAVVLLVNSDEKARDYVRAMVWQSGVQIRVFGFGSLSLLSLFLLDHSSAITENGSEPTSSSPPPSKTNVIILIDSNALVNSYESNLRFLIGQTRLLETPKFRFSFIVASPLQDSFNEDVTSLHGFEFFSKLAKPIRRKALIREIERIIFSESNNQTSHSPREINNNSSADMTKHGNHSHRRKSIIANGAWVGSHLYHQQELDAMSPVSSALSHQESSASSTDEPPSLLIVDDNKIIQRALSRMLAASFNCDLANDGKESIEMVDKKRYDCILMDFHMDVMDGITAAKLIRARADDKSKIPIIGLSADGQDETRRAAQQAGMNDFLVKPVQKNELMRVLNKVLSSRQSDSRRLSIQSFER